MGHYPLDNCLLRTRWAKKRSKKCAQKWGNYRRSTFTHISTHKKNEYQCLDIKV